MIYIVSGIFIGTMICMILSILFFPTIQILNKKISTYWIITLIGAIVELLIVRPDSSFYHEFYAQGDMNPFQILILFFSLTFLSITLDVFGFFQFLVSKGILLAKKNQYSLFFMLYIITAILTIFTSNDIIILTFTPFIILFCRKTNINPIPYLFCEFICANTFSMMLEIGNPTNIYLSQAFQIDFFEYFKNMAIPTLFICIISLVLMLLLFHKDLKKEISLKEEDTIDTKFQKKDLIPLFHLFICIILLSCNHFLHLKMWIICFACFLSLILFLMLFRYFEEFKKSIKRLPYALIPFLLSMFTMVLLLSYCGVTEKIVEALEKMNNMFSIGFISALSCSIMNNIPMSILFSSILRQMSLSSNKIIYSVIMASNIGAFFSPIGALAGVMWNQMLSREKIQLSFWKFCGIGCIIGIPCLFIGILMLFLI